MSGYSLEHTNRNPLWPAKKAMAAARRDRRRAEKAWHHAAKTEREALAQLGHAMGAQAAAGWTSSSVGVVETAMREFAPPGEQESLL
ncbi:MAG: hypothetical protein AAGA99_26300 [Actinomycetota bacterium]